jgi:hypothetical protein
VTQALIPWLALFVLASALIVPTRPRATRPEPSSAMTLLAYLVLMWLVWGGTA